MHHAIETQNKKWFHFSNNLSTYFARVFSKNASDRLYYTFITIFNKPFNFRDHNKRKIASEIFDLLLQDIGQNKTDREIYQALHVNMNSHVYSKNPPVIFTPGRADSRVMDITQILENIPNKIAINNYLDFGCGESSITSAVGYAIGARHVVGMDVNFPNKPVDFDFKLLDWNIPKIPGDSHSFDIITSLMVLHHVNNPVATISEMARVLKPGGLLIIREHDIDGEADFDGRTFLDMLHGFYEVVWATTGHQENPNHVESYFARYKNREGWTQLIIDAGFQRVESPFLNQIYNQADIPRTYQFGKKIINPFYFYYGVYSKI